MRYAIIENNVCVNVIIADEWFASSIGAIELPEGFGIGDSYENGKWTSNRIVPQEEGEP